MANKSKGGDDGGPNARVGNVIKGKWTIDSLLGVGGMAAVYAASHRNGQRAALKILHTDFAREKTICERFLREAYVSNKVNHGATVQVLDDDMTESGEPFLIMELLEGETVRDAWKKSGRTMHAGRVLQICEKVLDCLASCHAIKVIHRDLKPANIFILKENDEIRVLDFGVAQMRDATSERTATGTALGTPAYMSPEQAMGLVDQLDGRADLFSVGAMMHALITGHRINNGRTEQEALVMAATKPVPSVARLAPHLPIELIKVIDKSLAWDRRNRYQDAREMQKALIDLMPGQGVAPLFGRPPPRPQEVVAPPAPELPPSLQQAFSSSVGQASVSSLKAAAPAGPAAPVQPAPSISMAAAAAAAPAISVAPAPPPPVPVAAKQAPAFDPMLGGFSPMQSQSPAVPAALGPGEVPESDPRVQALRDLMKHCDRLFPSVRQLGWAHPATDRALRIAFDGFTEALTKMPTLVSWTVRPYNFMAFGHTVWEPTAPYDAIPYNLFACGIRNLRVEAGITLEELRELFVLLLLDPGRDLPPEDDLAAALWEKSLTHVKWDTVDAFAEGDAAEREAFYGETDQIEHLADAAAKNQMDRLEAQAMVVNTDDAALGKQKERSPFALDDQTKAHLAPHFELTHDVWAERFVDALVEGYLDSAAHRDAPLVLASLRRSAADLIVAGRLTVAVQINLAVIERLRARVQGQENQLKLAAALTNAMFGGETLELLLTRLKEDPSGAEAFAHVLPGLSSNEFAIVLAAFRQVGHPQVRQLLAGYIERHAGGREAELGQAAAGADPDTGAYIVQLLGRMQSPGARQVLGQLAQSEDVGVRVEARVLVAANPDQAQKEVSALLENSSALVRMAALRTSVRYGMRNAWPSIARVINGKGFNELGNDERRELLRACVVLSPERGEPVLLELAKKGGVLTSEEREATRAMAAELLGELSRSRPTAMALQEIANARWGVSEETRMAAANAAKRIGQRLAQPQGAAIA
ncbi:MAG: protein kinase [Labilithrix sp.]|nr:protein kinase [Labilithrix sp.]MCW5815547.1 protein kinase [Labilithrix sp.]